MRVAVWLLAGAVLIGGMFAVRTLPGEAGEGEAGPAQETLKSLRDTYRSAFSSGDAEALCKCFTTDAEYIDELGEVTRGRDAIREMAAGFFTAYPGATVSSEPDGLRLLGDGVAMQDGVVTITAKDGTVLSRSRVTMVAVRSGDEWVIASFREHRRHGTDALTPREHLAELAWMIGDWVEEADDAYVRSSCRWSEEGPYIIQKFEIRSADGKTRRASQRIAWDPLTRKIRSWSFGSDGGYSQSIWTKSGDSWTLQARSVSADGVLGTGTYVVTRQTEDIVRWEVKGWVLGDEPRADRTILIVRRPPEPR